MKAVTVCGIQIASIPGDVRQNVRKALDWLAKAQGEFGAEIAVFPESVTTTFNPGMSREALYDIVEPIPGDVTDAFCRASSDLNTIVVLPVYERGRDRPTIYNSAVLITPGSGVVGVYRKTHPFTTERVEGGGWTTPGHTARVYQTSCAMLGMMICYDGDFPELARVMAIDGAEVLARPSAFLRSYDIWHLTNAARAYDNHVYVVAVNAVGRDGAGNYYAGHSMVISPTGEKLAQARGSEEIIVARLDPDPMRYVSPGTRAPMVFDHLQDRNIAAYEGIIREARSAFEPALRVPYGRPAGKSREEDSPAS
ncbi:MAG: carbon-nitrogen hydrolase family protein [Bacillota bacterium]|jgi:predicted amidohydrolase